MMGRKSLAYYLSFVWVLFACFIDCAVPHEKSQCTELPDIKEQTNQSTLLLGDLREIMITRKNVSETLLERLNTSLHKVKGKVYFAITEELNALIVASELPAQDVLRSFVVMFYAPWCPFSAETMPIYHKLARDFPALPFFAVDGDESPSTTRTHSVYGFPSIMVFANGQIKEKYEDTREYSSLVTFLVNVTGVSPENNSAEDPLLNMESYSQLPQKQNVDYFLYITASYLFFLVIYRVGGNRLYQWKEHALSWLNCVITQRLRGSGHEKEE
jgi:thiol-disulfide isomerase/thioredoxin